MIYWDAPGPYVVAFSTRVGGVSEGPYESLNLGIFTADDPAKVLENRRRLADRTGIDPERARMAWQQHGAVVNRSSPEGILARVRHEPCDGWWSDVPGQGMMLLTADCLPVAIARANDAKPALAILHVGWRGLLDGIVQLVGPQRPALDTRERTRVDQEPSAHAHRERRPVELAIRVAWQDVEPLDAMRDHVCRHVCATERFVPEACCRIFDRQVTSRTCSAFVIASPLREQLRRVKRA